MSALQFIPASRRSNGLTARALLAIVGPDRVGEIETVTSPSNGYLVPEDVATEYRRRLTESKPATEKPPAKRATAKSRPAEGV